MQGINDVFDRVLVVNLDRRPERMAQIANQLDHFGIAFDRFPAVDARDPEIQREWRAYAEGALAEPPADQRPVTSYREFYLDYDSEQARVAFIESKTGRKAIATAGAWALLATVTAVAERALDDGWESLLVFEDDALLHRDTPELFDRIMVQVPGDWRVLQLGTMQLHWEEDWIEWYSYNLYKCRGSSIASHAFALRREAIHALLDACRKRDLPFDLGALHTIKRRFAEHSFTMFPNLAIQDAADSDIGMSTIFFREARKLDNIYRWHLPDYGLAAIKAQAATDAARDTDDGSGRISEAVTAPAAPPELRRGPFARLSRFAWPKCWRASSNPAPASSDAEPVAARGGPKPEAPHQPGGLPALKAHSSKQPRSRAIAAVVVGLEGETLVGVLDLLRAARTEQDIEPILLTDCDAFELFRDRGLVFEYLPIPEQRRRFAPDLDWDLHLLRRLALIRHKWQPTRIIAFGPAGRQLLTLWKVSPFEDDIIHQVACGTAAEAAHEPSRPTEVAADSRSEWEPASGNVLRS